MILKSAGFIFAAGMAIAQSPAARPTEQFEVASVKPSAPVPPSGGVYFGPPRGGPGTPDPGLITWTYARLRDLLMTAYNVKTYQLTGPEWFNTERYDIIARVPAGATKEEVRAMWRKLLAERFGVVLHHESKEFQVEELVIDKGGSKLKETTTGTRLRRRRPARLNGIKMEASRARDRWQWFLRAKTGRTSTRSAGRSRSHN